MARLEPLAKISEMAMEKEREREGERQRDFYSLGVSSQNVIDYLSCIAPNLGDDHDL